MDKKTVSALLRRDFTPMLEGAGFTCTGDTARRLLDPVVHVVEIVHRPKSHVFRVDLGVHVTMLGDAAGRPVDVAKVSESGCAWRRSVIAGFRSSTDTEFAYGTDKAQAGESVAFMMSEWPRQAGAFFDRRTIWPGHFLDLARSSLSTSTHPAHLLTYARVAALADDPTLAIEIATHALPRVPERADRLRAELDAIIGDRGVATPP